jgi:pyrimidine-nucleoside phosphorylase
VLTDMNSPIGCTIGNALETAEAIEILHGRGPDDLRDLTYALVAEMLRMGGISKTEADALRRIHQVVADGTALERMRRIVEAQGGDPAFVDTPSELPLARHRSTIVSPSEGYITGIDPLELGHASMGLGAGRLRVEDSVDPGAGIRLHAQIGDRVSSGDRLATLYASRKDLLTPGVERIAGSIRIGKRRPPKGSRIIETIRR